MTYDYCGTSVWGFTVTGKNGASIFLPHIGIYYVTVGAYDDEVKTHIEDLVIYRSSCLSHGNEDALSFGPNGYPDSKYWNIPEEWDKLKTWMTVTTLYGRYSGIAVRAVCK